MILFWMACTLTSEPVDECSEEEACPFGSVCVDGTCEAQSCATSDQCAIEYFCDSHECTPGCQLDSDCRFGDVCDTETGTCAASLCEDTHLDCTFGEFCSPIGECYEAGGYYCRPCEDDGDCGGGGNWCIWGDCQVACDEPNDCPAGFVCNAVQDYEGNILGNWCITSCD